MERSLPITLFISYNFELKVLHNFINFITYLYCVAVTCFLFMIINVPLLFFMYHIFIRNSFPTVLYNSLFRLIVFLKIYHSTICMFGLLSNFSTSCPFGDLSVVRFFIHSVSCQFGYLSIRSVVNSVIYPFGQPHTHTYTGTYFLNLVN